MSHLDVFILGAGFSKAIDCHMPTMKELTAAVRDHIESNGPSLPRPWMNSEVIGEESVDSIEMWMTYLSQRQPWLDESSNLYNQAVATQIRKYIEQVISERSWVSMTSAQEWLSSLVEQWTDREVPVITLNYDTLVERAARALRKPNINEGQGIALSQLYPPYFSNIRSRDASLLSAGHLRTFTYFKLHGSLNWHYSGREDFYGETLFYSDVSPWGSEIHSHEIDSHLSSQDKETLIIPPMAEKLRCSTTRLSGRCGERPVKHSKVHQEYLSSGTLCQSQILE